jgi:branched-chain amino acid transport system permease protein
MWVDVAQTIADGLMVGGLYATVALGITLVFGLVGIVNFAHGQLVMLGAYIAFFATAAGWSFWGGLAAAMLAMAAAGALQELAIFRRTLASPMAGLTASLGLIMVIENLAAAAFSADPRFLDPPLSGRVELGALAFSAQRLLVLALATALVGGFWLYLQKAPMGKAIRAMAQNRLGAALVGVRITRVSTLIFAVGSALAGAAGALYASLFAITPFMGNAPLMKGFILTVLGGLGSVPGAIAAGFLLGLAESFGSRYFLASFRDGYGFILLILTLLFLPRGLFAGRAKARV